MQDRRTLEEQVNIVISLLKDKTLPSGGKEFLKVVEWVKNFPTWIDQSLKERLKRQAYATFQITESQLLAAIEGVPISRRAAIPLRDSEDHLRSLLPKGGWFEWYDEYTRYNEAPLSYHIFASLAVLGAALGRRVHFSMGHFNIWPNYCVILVGPTGRTKKTIASDIAKELIKAHSLCPIMSDEPSPQAMTSHLAEHGGHCFVYGGELSVFFGKDKFKEGMIPKFLRMLDSPADFEVETIGRGKEVVHGLAISFIGGTTPGQFNTTMPAIVSSSGFMNRFIFVSEKDTERVFPRPWVGKYKDKLDATLERFKKLEGVVDFAPGIEDGWWNAWYRRRKEIIKVSTNDTLIEVMERLPGHLLRTAMLIHLVQCDNFLLCEKCLNVAKGFLEYLDRSTPELVQGIRQSAVANEADLVLAMLIRLGGAADHSTLLRRVASKMNAQQFKQHIRTLEEQGKVKCSKRGFSQFYIAMEEEGIDAT